MVLGLAVRASASGHNLFTLYHGHLSRMRRLGLRRYREVLLAQTRKAARQHRCASSTRPIRPATSGPSRPHDAQTLRALYDFYRTQQEKTPRSSTEVRRIMEREVLAGLAPSTRDRVRSRDIRQLVEPKERTARTRANLLLQQISAMLSLAMDQHWIESNPAWRTKKPGANARHSRP